VWTTDFSKGIAFKNAGINDAYLDVVIERLGKTRETGASDYENKVSTALETVKDNVLN
jgi:hypothetical protein